MKVLVIGAALSGIAVSKLMAAKGEQVWLTDMKPVKEKEELESLGIRVFDGGHPDFLKEMDWDLIIKNPGIKYSVPFVKYFVDKGYKMYNEIEIALRDHPEIRYLAITGTNGKTTTTTMLGEMLKKLNPNNVACGNVGLPVSEVVMDRDTDNLTLAIEIAGFQLLGCETFHPLASVIMNLTPDHVDYFGTVDAYYKSKTLVYQNQNENDFFIMNVDDENVREYCKNVPCQIITLSFVRTDNDLHVSEGKAWFRDIELFSVDKFRVPGMQNVQNALVAGCMAYLAGVDIRDIREFLESFMGVEHRIEYVAEIDGVRYYNDSKGTNVDSTIMALKAFDCPVHLLVGGYDKKTGFADLKPYVGNVKKMYAFGNTKEQFIPLGCSIELFDNMEQALNKAHEEAREGEVVLLSPACASWDQFPNYEVRGKLFKQQVHHFEDN